MPNPHETEIHLPDGRDITVVQPGTKGGSRNWRLSKEMYFRYDEYLCIAMKNWPNATEFTIPASMSPNTFEHRLRDSRQSCLAFGYNPQVQAWLQDVGTNLTVCMDVNGTSVWVREKGQRGRTKGVRTTKHERNNPSAGESALRPVPEIKPMPSEVVVRALVVVLSSRELNDQPERFRGRLPDALCEELMDKFNIGIAYDPDTDVTTIL